MISKNSAFESDKPIFVGMEVKKILHAKKVVLNYQYPFLTWPLISKALDGAFYHHSIYLLLPLCKHSPRCLPNLDPPVQQRNDHFIKSPCIPVLLLLLQQNATPWPRSTVYKLYFFFFLISISKCLRFRPQPVHGLQPLLNPNALPNSLACFWSSTVLGRIIAPKDVHVLIPETWNMLFDMAKGTLQVWLS